ncbi:Metallo-hydrolase/oxidoreductase [Apiospora marii]|uniref:Metallo-hydrolase/oxidoreductase n=1 Tax=Apiospora marii TaxID=335849 RepID=UPI00312CC2F6
MQASAPEYATTAAMTEGQPTIHDVFEPKTGTWQYVVADPDTLKAVIIDPVLDFDSATQVISTTTADALLALVEEKGYHVCMILETHAHADHLTAASYLRYRLGKGSEGLKPLVVAGQRIREMQEAIGEKYGVPGEEYINVFDKLFDDDETFQIGQLTAMAIHLPGHTPDHLGYKIGGPNDPDNVFCGDSLFNADLGTARCDFPGGSARDLFKSGRKLLNMPDHFKIWTGHDYPSAERGSPVPYMTVRDHRAQNKHLRDGVSEDEFVALREERDANLPAPKLLHQSLQVNIRTGQLPKPNEDGARMLHLPLKLSGEKW